MKFLQQYILEISKWKALATVGKLSDDAIKTLKAKNVVKPIDDYVKGVNKGTDEILRKADAKSVTTYLPKRADMMGSPTYALRTKGWLKDQFQVRTPYDEVDTISKSPIIRRHEADEINYMNKSKQRVEKQGKKFNMTSIPYEQKRPMVTSTNLSGQKIITPSNVGTHYDPNVIKNEKKLVDYTKKIYPENKEIHEPLSKLRKLSGEYENLKSLNKKDIQTIRKAGDDANSNNYSKYDPRSRLNAAKNRVNYIKKTNDPNDKLHKVFKKQTDNLTTKQIEQHSSKSRREDLRMGKRDLDAFDVMEPAKYARATQDTGVINLDKTAKRQLKYIGANLATKAAAVGGATVAYKKLTHKDDEKDKKEDS